MVKKTAATTTHKAPTTVEALLLTQNAEVKEIHLTLQKDGTLAISNIQSALKKKSAPECIGSYKYKQEGAIFVFGYIKGKAGTENKHELPPPHDEVPLFGDIVLTASKDIKSWSTPFPLKAADYEAFYTRAYGGFEEDDEGAEGAEEADAVEEDIVAEDAEDADEAEDAEEDEEDDEEAEDAEEAEGAEAEDAEEAEGVEEVAALPIPKAKPTKAKKSKKAAAASNAAAVSLAAYVTYLHVPSDQELKVEPFDSPYAEEGLHPKRKKILHAIATLFKEYLNGDQIQGLERAIYNGAINIATHRHVGKSWSHPPFVELYKMYAKHLSANFHPKSYVENYELFDRFKAGYVSFEELSCMDPYQLFEGRWKESFIQQQIREKRQLEGNRAMATDQFLCNRCKKRECTYYEMQTRSADEPMTIFITCLNCGKHWRQ